MNFKNMVVFANELSEIKECSIWSRVKPVVKLQYFEICGHTDFELAQRILRNEEFTWIFDKFSRYTNFS